MGSGLSPWPLLLLLLSHSVFWGSLQAITCFKCDLFNSTGDCERGESLCETWGNEECFVRKVYEDNRLLHGYQGCRDLCIPLSVFRANYQVEVECCHSVSFCNYI